MEHKLDFTAVWAQNFQPFQALMLIKGDWKLWRQLLKKGLGPALEEIIVTFVTLLCVFITDLFLYRRPVGVNMRPFAPKNTGDHCSHPSPSLLKRVQAK